MKQYHCFTHYKHVLSTAIRQDRTRGGRSSYDGCVTHLKNRVSTFEKKLKRVGSRIPLLGDVTDQSPDAREGTKSHRHLVAILNHDTHRQVHHLIIALHFSSKEHK